MHITDYHSPHDKNKLSTDFTSATRQDRRGPFAKSQRTLKALHGKPKAMMNDTSSSLQGYRATMIGCAQWP